MVRLGMGFRVRWLSDARISGVQPPLPFGERTRDCSPGHAGKEGPQLARTGASQGFPRAAAPGGFSPEARRGPRGGPDLSRDLAREAGPAWGSIHHAFKHLKAITVVGAVGQGCFSLSRQCPGAHPPGRGGNARMRNQVRALEWGEGRGVRLGTWTGVGGALEGSAVRNRKAVVFPSLRAEEKKGARSWKKGKRTGSPKPGQSLHY